MQTVTCPVEQRAMTLMKELTPDGSVVLERLTGGLTNDTFVAEISSRKVVIRVAAFGPDRESERRFHNHAFRLGIAPEILLADTTTGDHVVAYIQEQPTSRISQIEAVSATLRTLHTNEPSPRLSRTLDPLADVREWRQQISMEQAAPTFDAIEELIGPADPETHVVCHNDLAPANIIFREGRAFLIDWEYAAMGDPMFDIASYARHLTDGEQRHLLDVHYGSTLDKTLNALKENVDRVRGWTAVWALKQDRMKPDGFDYRSYAADTIELIETVDIPSLPAGQLDS